MISHSEKYKFLSFESNWSNCMYCILVVYSTVAVNSNKPCTLFTCISQKGYLSSVINLAHSFCTTRFFIGRFIYLLFPSRNQEMTSITESIPTRRMRWTAILTLTREMNQTATRRKMHLEGKEEWSLKHTRWIIQLGFIFLMISKIIQ